MLKNIILVRHGETEKNKNNPNRKLTKKGVQQMKETANKVNLLVKNSNSIILCSSTKRAIESAKILSKILEVPYRHEKTSLRVENIKILEEKYQQKTNVTFLYFKCFENAELPEEISSPVVVAQRFLKVVKKVKIKNQIIIVGHGSALETFALFQNEFIPNKRIRKELKYGEFVVLEKK